jgi:adenosylcobinamide kinase / adenosylcobinamide-phosphate guanylyltransferase
VTLTFLLGGARSGKSGLAVELARGEGVVTVIATAEGRDDEMRARIELHRSERPAEWATLEEPLELGAALSSAPADAAVIVDCLSLWVANLVGRGDADVEIEQQSDAAVARAGARPGWTIAVSNEVGLGIVPDNALARSYRDVLGRVNAEWVALADEAYFVVAGRLLRLE